MPELTKEQMEAVLKVNEELKTKLQTFEQKETDAIKKAEMDKLVEAVASKLHPVESKIVFSGEPKEGETKASFQKFLSMVRVNHPTLQKTVANETTNADGGYLVPIEYSDKIMGILYNVDRIVGKCSRISIGTNVLNIPTWLTGVTVYWIGEDTARTLVKFAFGQITLTMYNASCILPFTDEMFDDSIINVSEKTAIEVGKGIQNAMANQILEGTTPFTGIKTNTDVNAVAQEAGNLSYDDLVNLVFHPDLKDDYDDGANVILCKTDLKKVMKLKDANNVPLWNIGAPLGGIPSSILGYPYIKTDQITAGTIIYGNLSNVIVADHMKKPGVTVATSNSAVDVTGSAQNAFLQAQTWFRFNKRAAINMNGKAFVRLTGVK